NFYYLGVLQILAGIAWGSHELGMTLYLIETTEERLRSSILTWVNLTNSIAMFLGGLLGAQLLMNDGVADYARIFWLSSLLRIIPLGILVTLKFEAIGFRRIYHRVMGARPGGRIVAKPILLDEDPK